MASPSAKYSKSASSVTSATARATIAVEPHTTKPTTNGIKTTAVATRFQVIEKESLQKLQASSHHIERNKSRKRSRTDILACRIHGITIAARWKMPQHCPVPRPSAKNH